MTGLLVFCVAVYTLCGVVVMIPMMLVARWVLSL